MRSSLWLAAIALSLSMAGSAAQAQGVPNAIAGIICDTEEQLRTIVLAARSGDEGGKAAYGKLNAERNVRNKPACVLGQIPHRMVSVPDSIDLGDWPEKGRVFKASGLHLKFDEIEVWFLYVSSRSIDKPV